MNLAESLTCLTSLVIFKAILKHGRPVISRSPNQPFHLMSRLMSTAGSLMNLMQKPIQLRRSQTFKQQSFQSPIEHIVPYQNQGLIIRPVTGNRRPPVLVYRSGLAGYRSEPDKFKFKFKFPVQPVRTGIPAGLAGNRPV